MDDPSSKSQYFAGASSASVAGYDAYLNHGPNDMIQQEIELSRTDPLQEPLLRRCPWPSTSSNKGLFLNPSVFLHHHHIITTMPVP
jgi:hypothetical protein